MNIGQLAEVIRNLPEETVVVTTPYDDVYQEVVRAIVGDCLEYIDKDDQNGIGRVLILE